MQADVRIQGGSYSDGTSAGGSWVIIGEVAVTGVRVAKADVELWWQ